MLINCMLIYTATFTGPTRRYAENIPDAKLASDGDRKSSNVTQKVVMLQVSVDYVG